jgi:hypothetical protein
MGDENENLHVSPIELWGYTSGTSNLTDVDFQHLLFCTQCQSLVDQFMDALEDLPPTHPSQAA